MKPMKRLHIASLLTTLVLHLSMAHLANSSSNYTDQLALLAFKSSITLDPTNVLSNWTTETSFCGWAGISCSPRRQRVTVLNLRNLGLHSTIPPHIGNLSFLVYFELRNNTFRGPLPEEIGRLPRLESLILQSNMLQGAIPMGLQNCRKLEVISLAINNFSGDIPKELSTLPVLRILYLGQNNLTGTISPYFGNLSRLQGLAAEANKLHGKLPNEVAQLPNLKLINFGGNNLTGSIPPGVFNQSSMTKLYLNQNAFSGNLPSSGFWLPSVEIIFLQVNQLTGIIPSLLSNSSNLTVIDLSYNLFTGPLPKGLGNLKALQYLVMSDCQLMGEIPKEIGALTNLTLLALFSNNLNGTLPWTIGGLVRLQRFYLSDNNFHGAIPNEICLLSNLGEIYFDGNKLSGLIPSCIGNVNQLEEIVIYSNKLTSIPPSLWNLENLRILNLSFNSIGGILDQDMGAAKALEILDLSSNQISGNIPSSIGSFQRLSYVNLSRNSFSGLIPTSVGQVITLDFLDFSHNNLSGPIPKSLDALSHLESLDFSWNKLSGEIPNGGPFTNLTVQSVMGNEALCGNRTLQVPPCASPSSHETSMKTVLLRYILPGIALVVIIASLLYIGKKHRRNNARNHDVNELYVRMEHKMILYHELQHATENFCEANLLGVGSYGSVNKGVLSDGIIVAVKVLNLQLEGAFKSFEAECTVLRRTRHRNLVGVITTCSNPELRALVLQYMSNGSLQKWLYSHNYCLNLLQRVSIMIDVALALEYLHFGQSEPVVHCDLKPSNVLLDGDMIAHVADFGIAKILAQENTRTQTKTLGTIGYIAPEYGSEGRVTTGGDVYSYGIMILETFTRKKPTDEMFTAEVNLRQWVSASLPDNVLDIVDSGLLETLNEGDMVSTTSILIAILELGLECSRELAEERADIREVISKLKKMNDQLLRVPSV